METISIGPMLISLPRLVSLGALLALMALGAALARHREIPLLARWSSEVAVVILVAARLAFVALHWSAYATEPWRVLYVLDGGFTPLAGLAAALPYTFWRLRRDTSALLWAPLPLVVMVGIYLGGHGVRSALDTTPQSLPQVQVQRLDGSPMRLGQDVDGPILVNLWATWCGPCRREMPLLVDFAREHPHIHVRLVNQGEDVEQVKPFLSQLAIPQRLVRMDPQGEFGQAMEVAGYPTTLLYDGTGQLRYKHVGELSEAQLSRALSRLPQSLALQRH